MARSRRRVPGPMTTNPAARRAGLRRATEFLRPARGAIVPCRRAASAASSSAGSTSPTGSRRWSTPTGCRRPEAGADAWRRGSTRSSSPPAGTSLRSSRSRRAASSPWRPDRAHGEPPARRGGGGPRDRPRRVCARRAARLRPAHRAGEPAARGERRARRGRPGGARRPRGIVAPSGRRVSVPAFSRGGALAMRFRPGEPGRHAWRVLAGDGTVDRERAARCGRSTRGSRAACAPGGASWWTTPDARSGLSARTGSTSTTRPGPTGSAPRPTSRGWRRTG